MTKYILILCAFCGAIINIAFTQVSVRVEPSNLRDSRPLPVQTGAAAIRDYLESWQSMRSALEQNRVDMLDPAFVGTARDKLSDTILQQVRLGLSMRYQDRSHNIQIVFYSPEGLSIEMIDNVTYDVHVIDHKWSKTIQSVSARYVIVLTPAEVRWRVRVFQAVP